MITKCNSSNDIKNGGSFSATGGPPVSGSAGFYAWTQNITNLDAFSNFLSLAVPKDLTYPVISGSGDLCIGSGYNVEANVFYAASGHHAIYRVDWSYAGSGNLNGGLVIKDGTTTIFQNQITNFGAGFNEWNYPNPLMGRYNQSMNIILLAGGLGASGQINHVSHRVI